MCLVHTVLFLQNIVLHLCQFYADNEIIWFMYEFENDTGATKPRQKTTERCKYYTFKFKSEEIKDSSENKLHTDNAKIVSVDHFKSLIM